MFEDDLDICKLREDLAKYERKIVDIRERLHSLILKKLRDAGFSERREPQSDRRKSTRRWDDS